jgi:multidrug resistance protein MdtO
MLFRIVGATIGGIIFGIGCIIFVFPYADTAIPFLVTVTCVSFIGAWFARSAHFSYVGLQIVFSFYLTVFEGFSAPTNMTFARDRLIGVFLALVVMWMIFHQLHPERTVDKMRHGLARLLTIEADLMSLLRTARLDKVPALREEANELVGTLRALAEVIPYEVDHDIERERNISEQIQNAASTAGSVFLTTIAWPRTSEIPDWANMVNHTHAVLEQGLRNLSQLLEGTREPSGFDEHRAELSGANVHGPRPTPIQNALDLYTDLQSQCRRIELQSRESGLIMPMSCSGREAE